MSKEHTPGPWYIESLEGSNYIMAKAPQAKVLWIAKVSAPEDAVLIQAAPELLTFVKNVIEGIEIAGMKKQFAHMYPDAVALVKKIEG